MAEFDALYRAHVTRSDPAGQATPTAEAAPPKQEAPAAPSVPSPAPVASAVPAASQTVPEAAVETPREVEQAPEVYAESSPVQHWSSERVLDDQSQLSQQPFRRDLAASDAVTTSALVLPGFPQSGSLTAPVSSTGEILITGTIDLPRSLGASGMDRSRYDQADVDFADGFDREDAAPDTAPVRAIRAISTHTSSQGIISAKRPKGNNLPVILSITAGVMAVSVVVLFVAAMVFKIF